MRRFVFSLCLISFLGLLASTVTAQSDSSQATIDKKPVSFKKLSFKSDDEIAITADLYMAHQDKKTPFIVLCHQAGWSRGEYLEIAPKLNALGFNCLAIDQRSGGEVNGVSNETARKAAAVAAKPVQFPDAEQDMVAAISYAKTNYAQGKLILWGSSYSAGLALRIAGEHPDKIDGVLAFAPGEYFERSGKSRNWVQQSARKIGDPVFITSAKNEFKKWRSISEAVPAGLLHTFLPKTKGNHGSRALWEKFSDNKSYWVAVKAFLKQIK